MKIGIDARFWGYAGPGRYVKNLVLNLEKIDHENEYVIFLNRRGLEEYQPKNSNFRKAAVNVSWYSFMEQIKLPFIFAREKLDLLHIPHFNIPAFYPGKMAVTIHDLTIHRFSTKRATTRSRLVNLLKRAVYRVIFGVALRKAFVIFTPTEFVKKDLLKEYRWLSENKVAVTQEGVGETFVDGKSRPYGERKDGTFLSEILNTKYGVCKPYILYVGSMYPHKNLPRLVEAFGRLAEKYEDLNLVLVGKRDYFQERLRNEVEGKTRPCGVRKDGAFLPCGLKDRLFPSPASGLERVVFPAFAVEDGYVPDEDLAVFYQNALAFVFPSLSEGFGLPPLEAMSFGVPVAVSKSTSIPEVCGGAALYFDAENIEDMEQKMKALVKNSALREDLIQKGFANLKRFSWSVMARVTLNGYFDCLK